MIKSNSLPQLSRFLSIFLFIVVFQAFSSTLVNAAHRTITFTNDTGGPVDDLHIITKKGTTVVWKTTTPFTSERGKDNSPSHNLYGATIPKDGTATVSLHDPDSDTIEVKDSWWTKGGNALKDGERVGDKMDDDGSNQFSVAGGPAAGDAAVLVTINGESNIFVTTPGSTPDGTKAEFSAFLATFIDGEGNELIHQGFLESSNLLYASNLLSTAGGALTTEILSQDSGQFISLLAPEPGPPVFRFSITANGGSCPGIYTGEIEDALPGGQVAIYEGTTAGEFPSDECPGVMLEIADPVQTQMLIPDENGTATYDFEAVDCSGIYIQALDLASCTLGNITAPAGY